VTGTGNMMLSASPTTTGTLTAGAINASGVLSITGGTSNVELMQITNSAGTNPYGILLNYSGSNPNDTTHYFFNFTTTGGGGFIQGRSNGGIANYSANDVNLSDLDVKPFTKAYETATLWGFGKRMRSAWMQFKYDDQTHDDWNNGYGAQLVQEAAGNDFPELVELSNWGTKDKPQMRLSVYDNDLLHIMGAITTESQFRIDDHEARLTALQAEFESYKAAHP